MTWIHIEFFRILLTVRGSPSSVENGTEYMLCGAGVSQGRPLVECRMEYGL
jgi:hypothetical protein